jgi:CBS domain-containing protein
MNISISTLMNPKSSELCTVTPKAMVAEAVRQMNQHRVGSVLVMDGDRLAGIFTERDVLRRVVGVDLDPKTTPVTNVMTTLVLTIGPDATLQQLMEMFTDKRMRHMPVAKDGKVVGMISISDVSRWVAQASQAEAETLRQYIAGGLST